ncbi:ABC transporter substrate-binding protein [Novosphingobium guangzhouense]|uniref:Solute-binding protein family 5 domain-containing protein n=1 Tax=Novosphingobium guangzhouense TaxID=1850347 RepID=A0A2K2G3A7_9SPHN|nr:ABC transporter substrate-binding protein [Novosphingobium guangzhouense]PNU05523.1 hypothetical protein A8V01_16225 [Novosphingobium guangzhouense]
MYDDDLNALSRRSVLGMGGVLAMLPLLEACGGASEGAGNTLVVAISIEPTTLTSAITSAGGGQLVSPKIFDGLLTYSADLKPEPGLAQAWNVSDDKRTLTLNLRPGVKWHDGKPFTSADVAYSALSIWSKYHSRGRMTFARLVAVDTPDPLTAVLRFSDPAPYALSALASFESQVVPRHVYEGRDVLSNPANNAPIGTGPFRFVEWQRGQFIRLERNRDYWDKGKPALDGVIFRVIGESAANAAALETGEIQFTNGIAPGDIARVSKLPDIVRDDRNFALPTAGMGLEFNLDVPKLRDVRVRRAVAHAIDPDFILKHILFGNGVIDRSPISSVYKDFHSEDVPLYPFDPERAKALLDEAGLKPDAKGARLSFTLDPTPSGERSIKLAEYIRSALARVGIRVELRSQDFATFVKRIYTDRDFEVALSGGQMGPDPVIGTQRFYWSKSFKPGVAFSNGAHYHNPALDRALEAAQVEPDIEKRRAYYAEFQRIAQTDLPRIPLYTTSGSIFSGRRLSRLPDTAEGFYGNFADLKFN